MEPNSIPLAPTRTLTVEPNRDTYQRPTGSKLRLKGRWLANAGFNPGDNVLVQRIPGGLLIRLCQFTNEPA